MKNKRIILLAVAVVIGPAQVSASAVPSLKRYYAHPAVEDRHGVIAPWHSGQNGQLDERIRIAAELFKRYPWVGADKAVLAAPHMIYNTHWSITADGTISIPPTDPWMCGDLSQRTQSIIQDLTKHYAYSGDPLAFVYIPLICDYVLDYCLTDDKQPWPRFPISTPTKGIGYNRADPNVPNQLDLCALLGVEMVRAYRLTGTTRYADTARHWGDVIAQKCNFENPDLPPWSRYTSPQYMTWSDKLTGSTALITDFLDALLGLGHSGEDGIISKARDAGRAYLVNHLLPRWTDNEVWGRHYWDWEAAVMTGCVPWICEYFMDHPDAFANWRNDVRNILTLIFNRNGVDPASRGDMYSGAWAFPESSSCCGTSLSYNQYTYAPAFIRYGEMAGDERMREIGRRMILMATYDSSGTGYVLDGLAGEVVAAKDWLNLAQPWPLCQTLKAISWRPEIFAPGRENHIVSSTSVVNHVLYEKGRIKYSTFDAPPDTVDVVRLAFAPASVTVDGRALGKRSDLNSNGFINKALENGDCIVRIRHDGFRNVVVEGPDPQTAVAGALLKLSGPWQDVAAAGHVARGTYIASEKGATAAFSFTGNQVRLSGGVGPDGGLADIYLDGVRQLTQIDCYNPTAKDRQVLYHRSGLADAEHELKVVAGGAGNLISRGTRIFIDGLQYSDARGTTGYGEGGGPTTAQRLIFGYTGRRDYVDSQGKEWRPGTEFVVRTGYNTDSVVMALDTERRSYFIGGTADQEIYRYGLYGKEFWVNVSAGPGDYYVRLFLADTNFHQKMKVLINGLAVTDCLDVEQEAGGLFRAMERTYPAVRPKNGAIEIRFISCEGRDAAVQALEVGPWAKPEGRS
jgi:hypothetical protein